MSIPDYYSILEIEANASDKEIKQAFWRLAKKFHPDKNPGNERSAEQKFKQIISAYEILINKETRCIYDERANLANIYSSYKENLLRKAKKDVVYLCRLVLLELLNHNPQSALEIYESLALKIPGFSLDPYMSDADTRDCEFLLAEAYHRMGKLSQAAWLYERILEKERKKIYFRSFAQEIKLLLKDIYVHYIRMSECSEEIFTNMEKILAMGLSKNELAWIYKKTAEAYYRVNDMDNALESLRQAFQIYPKLSGAKRISKKLWDGKGNG